MSFTTIHLISLNYPTKNDRLHCLFCTNGHSFFEHQKGAWFLFVAYHLSDAHNPCSYGLMLRVYDLSDYGLILRYISDFSIERMFYLL